MEALRQAIKAVTNAIDEVSALEGEYPKTMTELNRLFTVKADLEGELAKQMTLDRAPKRKKKEPEE